MVSYEELTTKILSNCGKEKIVHLGDKIFIDEHLLKLENLLINGRKKQLLIIIKKLKVVEKI